MIAKRIATIAQVARVAREEGEFRFALCDFLDGFYANPSRTRLADEPELLSEALDDKGLADAYLAAACDFLCRRYRLERPEWIKSPERILATPHFEARTHGLRMILLEESPPPFRERNIFVSANALSRA